MVSNPTHGPNSKASPLLIQADKRHLVIAAISSPSCYYYSLNPTSVSSWSQRTRCKTQMLPWQPQHFHKVLLTALLCTYASFLQYCSPKLGLSESMKVKAYRELPCGIYTCSSDLSPDHCCLIPFSPSSSVLIWSHLLNKATLSTYRQGHTPIHSDSVPIPDPCFLVLLFIFMEQFINF